MAQNGGDDKNSMKRIESNKNRKLQLLVAKVEIPQEENNKKRQKILFANLLNVKYAEKSNK